MHEKGFINKLKGVLASAAAVVMTVGMIGGSAIPAMAAENVVANPEAGQTLTVGTQGEDKTISIQTPSGEGLTDTSTFTYTIYKIFNATSNGNAVSYTKLNDSQTLPIYDGTDDSTSTSKFDLDGTNVAYYTKNASTGSWDKDTDGNKPLTDAMIAKLGTTELLNSYTKIGTVTITGAGQTGTVQLADYGYYYITSTTGSVVAINTNKTSAAIGDKNTVPTVDKTADEFTNEIGKNVTYTATVHLKKGSESVIFYDTLSNGLTLNGSAPTSVKVGDNDLATGNYTVTYFSSTPAGSDTDYSGKNIVITFSPDYLNTITSDTDVVITYSATVNANAVVNDNNEAYIKYGNNSNYESTHKKVYESTFKFGIRKTDGTNTLTGAKFILAREKEDDFASVEDTAVNNLSSEKKAKLVPLDNDAKVTPSGTNYVVEVKNDGTITFNGLDGDDNGSVIYYLYEVKAPQGHNKLTTPYAVKITPTFDTTETSKVVSYKVSYNTAGTADGTFADAGTYTVNADSASIPTFDVVNTAGSLLPSTGGIGTTIFYVIGGVVVAGAVILLLARRRKNA